MEREINFDKFVEIGKTDGSTRDAATHMQSRTASSLPVIQNMAKRPPFKGPPSTPFSYKGKKPQFDGNKGKHFNVRRTDSCSFCERSHLWEMGVVPQYNK